MDTIFRSDSDLYLKEIKKITRQCHLFIEMGSAFIVLTDLGAIVERTSCMAKCTAFFYVFIYYCRDACNIFA